MDLCLFRFVADVSCTVSNKIRGVLMQPSSRRLGIVCAILMSFLARQAPGIENAIERWAAAVGGHGRIAAIKAVYREGTIQVAGLAGTIKVCHTAEGRYRKEEQVGTFSTIETFDGIGGMATQNGA